MIPFWEERRSRVSAVVVIRVLFYKMHIFFIFSIQVKVNVVKISHYTNKMNLLIIENERERKRRREGEKEEKEKREGEKERKRERKRKREKERERERKRARSVYWRIYDMASYRERESGREREKERKREREKERKREREKERKREREKDKERFSSQKHLKHFCYQKEKTLQTHYKRKFALP
jgi:septal ring factor EnvC (AmiA/AmiB activator)